MAMDIWLLRHAAAQERAPSGRDEDRELTPEGFARAAAVGRGMAALSPPIVVVLTSPLIRARQTAEASATALGLEAPRPWAGLLPGTDPSRTIQELAREGWPSVLLVGHQPLLGALLGLLLFGDARQQIPLRKAAVARLNWTPGGSGTLEGFVPPEIFERLGSAGADRA